MASSSAYYSNEEATIQREVDVNQSVLVRIPTDRLKETYEIERCVEYIKERKSQKVALQFPDSLLVDAANVAWQFERDCDAKIYVLADTFYGHSDVDEVNAKHVDADLLIHYGETSLTPSATIPTLFVFGRHPKTIVVKDVCDVFYKTFPAKLDTRVVFLHHVTCNYIADQISSRLLPDYPYLSVGQLNIPKDPGGALGNSDSKEEEDNILKDLCTKSCPGCPCRLENGSSKGDAGRNDEKKGRIDPVIASGSSTNSNTNSSKNVPHSSGGEIAVKDPSMNSATRDELRPFAADNHDNDLSLNGSTEASTTMEVDSHKPDCKDYVTGFYTIPLEFDKELADYNIFYLGPRNAESLRNLMLSHPSCEVHIYDPTNGYDKMQSNTNRQLMKRYYLVEKAKDAQIVGILVGTMGVAGYLECLNYLKKIAKAAGKKTYTFIMGKLTPEKLANFLEIDLYVLVANPEHSILDSSNFYRPVVTPYEFDVACNPNREWSGNYITDFRTILPGHSDHVESSLNGADVVSETSMSLITGNIRSNIDIEDSLSSNGAGHEVALRNERTDLAVFGTNSSAERLSQRSWKGLEQKIGETPVTALRSSDSATTAKSDVLAVRNIDKKIEGRVVSITWERPKTTCDLSQYRCSLRSSNKKYEKSQKVQDLSVDFHDLKNGDYSCSVTAEYKNGLKEGRDLEISVNTKRDPLFDIRKEGRATNLGYEQHREGWKLSWTLPKIGERERDFKWVGGTLTLFKRTDKSSKKKKWKQLVREHINNEEEFVTTEISYGAKYKMSLTTTFRDHDTEEPFVQEEEKKFSLELPTPENLNVQTKGEILHLKWNESTGALEYAIQIFSLEENRTVFTSNYKKTKAEIKMTRMYRYGRKCRFSVTAQNGETASLSKQKELVIGGERAVREVVACEGRADPMRSIEVHWKAPDKIPDSYNVVLRSKEENVGKPDKVKENSHTFRELTSGVLYFCVVTPVYSEAVMKKAVSMLWNTTEVGGSWSNETKTRLRQTHEEEKEAAFGRPSKITYDFREEVDGRETYEFHWKEPTLNENYRLEGYDVDIREKGSTTAIFQESGIKEHGGIKVQLDRGILIVVTITSKYIDLDSKRNHSAKYQDEIYTKPSRSIDVRCSCKEGTVTYEWDRPNYVKRFDVCIYQESLKEKVKEKLAIDDSSVTFHLDDKLRFGKTYILKITMEGIDGHRHQCDPVSKYLGDVDAPRNVIAKRNPENPVRWVDIYMDNPLSEKIPCSCHVIAVPRSGNTKTVRRKADFKFGETITMKYLRSDTKYLFIVHANYCDGSKSEASHSNEITTNAGDFHHHFGAIQQTGFEHSPVKLSHVKVISNIQYVPAQMEKNFGQVRNLKCLKQSDGDRLELHKIVWDNPWFSGRSGDYKVDSYSVTVTPDSYGDCIDEKIIENSIEVKLREGANYCVEVTTYFEDLDGDLDPQPGKAQIKWIVTKPCKVSDVQRFWENGTLKLRWQPSKGAKTYEVRVTDAKNNSLRKRMCDDTSFEWTPQNNTFGESYNIIIASIGETKLENLTYLDPGTLGGDYVPRNVEAEAAEGDGRFKKAVVKWEEPKEKPLKYLVNAEGRGGETVTDPATVQETFHEFDRLEAGTTYVFSVEAIYEDKKSAKSFSREMRTEPKPNKVTGLRIKKDESNPSRNIVIEWDKLGADIADEYEIKAVMPITNSTRKERVSSSKNHYTMKYLTPSAKYFIRVRAWNDEGCGHWSEKSYVETDPGEPEDVSLENESEMTACHTLSLSFLESAEGSDHYLAALKKKGNNEVVISFSVDIEVNVINEVQDVEPSPAKILSTEACELARGYRKRRVDINGLEENTEYIAEVQAFYKTNDTLKEGRKIRSKSCWTAVVMFQKPTVKLAEDGDGKSSQNVEISWLQTRGCREHRVRVSYGEDSTEKEIIVVGANKYLYQCENPSKAYYFQVQSKNLSKHFGKLSDKEKILLAPPPPGEILLERDGEKISVKWDPIDTAQKYLLKVLTRSHQEEPQKDTTIEVPGPETHHLFSPKSSTIYSFLVSGESVQDNGNLVRGKSRKSDEIVSKPKKARKPTVSLNENDPFHAISVKQPGGKGKAQSCDFVEISLKRVEIGEKEDEDLQSLCYNGKPQCTVTIAGLKAGCKYAVKQRSWFKSVEGEWSGEAEQQLRPDTVRLVKFEVVERKCKAVWNGLEVKPSYYKVKLYQEGRDKEIKAQNTDDTEIDFEDLRFGFCYYCAVQAVNSSGESLEAKSEVLRCEWERPDIKLDDENTSESEILLKWDWPDGVDSFKLFIDGSNPQVLNDNKYIFDRGEAGHNHRFQLHCGQNGVYDTGCSARVIKMAPAIPKDVKVCHYNLNPTKVYILVTDPEPRPPEYKITVYQPPERDAGKSITQKENKFVLSDIDPAKPFIVGIKSVDGPLESKEKYSEQFETVLRLPRNSRVEQDRTGTKLVVSFEDEENKLKRYQIKALDETDHKTHESRLSKNHEITLDNLTPGHDYSIWINTYIAEDEEGSEPKIIGQTRVAG